MGRINDVDRAHISRNLIVFIIIAIDGSNQTDAISKEKLLRIIFYLRLYTLKMSRYKRLKSALNY